jgi:hypothetical protein
MRTLFRTSILALLLALPMLVNGQTSTARFPLLEQYTGTWCQYCPYGADSVSSILNYIPNARALAYHNQDPMATADGDAVTQHLLVGSFPTASIDRLLVNLGSAGTAIAISRSYWGAVMAQRAQQSSPMSISVSGTYHQDTRQISATVTMNVLSDMTGEFISTPC